MNRLTQVLLVVLLMAVCLIDIDAQTTGKKKFVKPTPTEEKDAGTEPADTKTSSSKPSPTSKSAVKKDDEPSRWGFGVNLGNIGFSSTAVAIGLDPNVAYRLEENLAVGFMMKMNYYHAKYYNTLNYSSFDWGPTIFARWKPLMLAEKATPFMQGIFLQTEFERSYVSREAIDEFGNLILNDDGTKILTEVNAEHYLYVGAGLSSGYPFSSFISFHYNILDDAELSRLPFTYRIGFTWNY